MTGTIFDIKEMAVHDGPGLRTTVFFKGCPLRCRWCHNPEGLSKMPQLMYKSASCKACGACRKVCNHDLCKPYGRCILSCPENCLEITGRELVADELAKELLLTADVLGGSFGGFTFSGGEPLMQSDFLLELVQTLSGFHLCMETSGFAEPSVFLKAAEKMDLVIMDLKLANRELHWEYTGQYNDLILQNAKTLQKSGIPHLFRTPLIPGITDTEENLTAIETFVGNSPWEKLPYNELCGAKYEMLGMEFPMKEKTEIL